MGVVWAMQRQQHQLHIIRRDEEEEAREVVRGFHYGI